MSFNLVLTDEAFYDRWSLLFFLDCGFFLIFITNSLLLYSTTWRWNTKNYFKSLAGCRWMSMNRFLKKRFLYIDLYKIYSILGKCMSKLNPIIFFCPTLYIDLYIMGSKPMLNKEIPWSFEGNDKQADPVNRIREKM